MTLGHQHPCILQNYLHGRIIGESVKSCSFFGPHVRGLYARVVVRDFRMPREIVRENTADIEEMRLKQSYIWHGKRHVVEVCNHSESLHTSKAIVEAKANCEKKRVIDRQRDVARELFRIQASE